MNALGYCNFTLRLFLRAQGVPTQLFPLIHCCFKLRVVFTSFNIDTMSIETGLLVGIVTHKFVSGEEVRADRVINL